MNPFALGADSEPPDSERPEVSSAVAKPPSSAELQGAADQSDTLLVQPFAGDSGMASGVLMATCPTSDLPLKIIVLSSQAWFPCKLLNFCLSDESNGLPLRPFQLGRDRADTLST